METFIQTRLDPILTQEGSYYSTILDPDKNSMKQKKVRDSFVIFRSSSTAGALEGVDVDYVSLDEYDRVKSGGEDSAKQAMASSKLGMFRRWSTPTTPGFGIHKAFMQSDQKYYMHKCEHCGLWQKLEYRDYDPDHPETSGNIRLINPEGVDELARTVQPGSYQFVCQKCGKLLDRWYNGEWVAKYPERTGTSGYFISQMNAVWISADKLKTEELNARSRQTFYNYVLGEPYEDLSMTVKAEDIYGHGREDMPTQRFDREGYSKIVVAIDWGTSHSVVVTGLRPNGQKDILRAFQVKETSTFSDINADLKHIMMELDAYQPDLILADLGYNGNKVVQLQHYFGEDKVFGVHVNPSSSRGEVKPVWNLNSSKVTIDKLTQNIANINEIKSGKWGFWKQEDAELDRFVLHFSNLIIRDEEDDNGDFYKIITRKGAD